MDKYIDEYTPLLIDYGIRIVTAIIVLIVGKFASKICKNIFIRLANKREMDAMASGFIGNIIHVAIWAFFIVSALGQLGIQTASFVAVIGAAGLAIGLALQGSLSNFAAGFLIIIFKPFRVGHFIEVNGITGIVQEIEVFTTTLKSGDNKKIIVPNSQILSSNIVNYSAQNQRRIDLTMGIGYSDDIDLAKKILLDEAQKHPSVLQSEEIRVAVHNLGESSVDIIVRPWVKSEDYWPTYWDLTESMKKRIDAEGLNIPFPQRDIHVHQVSQ